jgi:hypothetical protein
VLAAAAAVARVVAAKGWSTAAMLEGGSVRGLDAAAAAEAGGPAAAAADGLTVPLLLLLLAANSTAALARAALGRGESTREAEGQRRQCKVAESYLGSCVALHARTACAQRTLYTTVDRARCCAQLDNVKRR